VFINAKPYSIRLQINRIPAKIILANLVFRCGNSVVNYFMFVFYPPQETRAPNILTMVQAFNRLALLVPTEILEEKTPTARAKVIAAYIQVIITPFYM